MDNCGGSNINSVTDAYGIWLSIVVAVIALAIFKVCMYDRVYAYESYEINNMYKYDMEDGKARPERQIGGYRSRTRLDAYVPFSGMECIEDLGVLEVDIHDTLNGGTVCIRLDDDYIGTLRVLVSKKSSEVGSGLMDAGQNKADGRIEWQAESSITDEAPSSAVGIEDTSIYARHYIRPGEVYKLQLADGTGDYSLRADNGEHCSLRFFGYGLEGVSGTTLRAHSKRNKQEQSLRSLTKSSTVVDYAEHAMKIEELWRTDRTIDTIFSRVSEYEYDNDFAKDIGDSKVLLKDIRIDIDDIINSEKGICLSKSVLLAACLRYEGYPTRMVFGDCEHVNEYHAWVESYVDDVWVIYDAVVKKRVPLESEEGKAYHPKEYY